eukprot:Sspe_Gene.48850::Locus_25797_Transcript_1_1_Confidence_1.000_Length_1667::g.48850::m.48850
MLVPHGCSGCDGGQRRSTSFVLDLRSQDVLHLLLCHLGLHLRTPLLLPLQLLRFLQVSLCLRLLLQRPLLRRCSFLQPLLLHHPLVPLPLLHGSSLPLQPLDVLPLEPFPVTLCSLLTLPLVKPLDLVKVGLDALVKVLQNPPQRIVHALLPTHLQLRLPLFVLLQLLLPLRFETCLPLLVPHAHHLCLPLGLSLMLVTALFKHHGLLLTLPLRLQLLLDRPTLCLLQLQPVRPFLLKLLRLDLLSPLHLVLLALHKVLSLPLQPPCLDPRNIFRAKTLQLLQFLLPLQHFALRPYLLLGQRCAHHIIRSPRRGRWGGCSRISGCWGWDRSLVVRLCRLLRRRHLSIGWGCLGSAGQGEHVREEQPLLPQRCMRINWGGGGVRGAVPPCLGEGPPPRVHAEGRGVPQLVAVLKQGQVGDVLPRGVVPDSQDK